jgi:hypothetical protein
MKRLQRKSQIETIVKVDPRVKVYWISHVISVTDNILFTYYMGVVT